MLSTSKVVGKDFYKDPGLHRTLSGDGLATATLVGIALNLIIPEKKSADHA